MAQEAIERTILNFCPQEKGSCYEEKGLGRIKGTSIEVVYGIFPYQQRVTSLPGEPFITAWTRQPVLALTETVQQGEKFITYRRTLAYVSDVKSLPEGIAEKLGSHLENWSSLTRKIFGEWEV